MDAMEMRIKFANVPEGSEVFISYIAGRSPTPRAVREARRAERMGMSRRHFVGRFHRLWTAKNGDPILTVLCHNRDSERTGEQQGYRSFNANLGQLLSAEVL